MEENKTPACPYCGNAATEACEGRYHCTDPACDRLFDADDIIREGYRHRISHLLADTDEDNQMGCSITIGEDQACGVGTLELPEVVSCFQVPGDGTIWFHLYGETDPSTGEWGYTNFDEIETEDLRRIAEGLEEMVR